MSKFLATLLVLSLVGQTLGHGGPENVKTCFAGYTLYSDGKCYKEVDQPAEPVCPSGTLSQDGTGCDVLVPYITKCAEGQTPEGDGCAVEGTEPATFFCPPGYTDDGNDCIQTIPGEVIEVCEDGAERVGENCVVKEKLKHIENEECPPGAIFEEGKCWVAEETYDCSEDFDHSPKLKKAKGAVAIAVSGPQSEGPKPATGPAALAALRVARAKQTQPPTGKETEVSPPVLPTAARLAPRPSKVGVLSTVCQRLVEVDTIKSKLCPEGSLDFGDCCVVETITPVQRVCSTTGLLTEECPPIINHTPKEGRCIDGTPAVNGECPTLVLVSSEKLCPKGFTDNGVGCTGTVEAPLECPAELSLTEDGRCCGTLVKEAIDLDIAPEHKAKPKSVCDGLKDGSVCPN